jgi:hypothetical protein
MAQGYGIPINPDDFNKLVASIKAARTEVGGLNQDVKQLNQSTKQVGVSGASTTLGGRRVSDVAAIRDFIGPRPATASQIARQLKSDEAEERRTREQFFRMWDKRAGETLKPKTQAEKERETFLTSRILPDGSLSPIVGKALASGLGSVGRLGGGGGSLLASATTSALGGLTTKGLASGISALTGASSVAAGESAFLIASAAAAAIPLIVAGAAGAAAITAGIGFIEGGAGRIRTGSNAYWQTGGNPVELGQALALGGDNAGGKAEALGERLRQGGYAAAIARQHGITDLGDYFTPDKATNYIKALRLLRDTKDPVQRIRLARGLGLQEDAWTSDLDSPTFERLAGSRGEYGEGPRRSEARYRASKEIVGNKLDQIWRDSSPTYMDAVSGLLSGNPLPYIGVNTGITPLVKGSWDIFKKVGGGIIKTIADPSSELYKRAVAAGYIEDDKKSGASSSGSGASTGQVYRKVKDGPDWVNADARARGAVPPGIVAQAMDTQFNFDNLNLGGFSAAPQ